MNPVLVDERDHILAGHGRWLAAKRLGLSTIPVVERSHLTAAQKRAYVLADNRLAELAGWDPKMLGEELGALRELGLGMGVLGWTAEEMDRAIALAGAVVSGQTDADVAPPLPAEPFVRTGDLWALGRHGLLVGDATKPSDVGRLLHERRAPVLLVTDPPYGVAYDPSWRARAGLGSPGNARPGMLTGDQRADWTEAWALFPGAVAYVWHDATKAHLVGASLAAVGFEIRAQIVWVKDRFPISRRHYHFGHEAAAYAVRTGADDRWQGVDHEEPKRPDDPVARFEQLHDSAFYAVREGKASGWHGGRKQSTVWKLDGSRVAATGHPTQKPVDAMRRPIENNSLPGDAVYDPFVGSGTSIVAAESTGRTCLAIDIDPGWAQVALQRWADYTRTEPVLEATGQTLSEVRAERKG